jgi:hypothetical protein
MIAKAMPMIASVRKILPTVFHGTFPHIAHTEKKATIIITKIGINIPIVISSFV